MLISKKKDCVKIDKSCEQKGRHAMKTKILLSAITVMMITSFAAASGSNEENGYGYSGQQVIVNNYYYDNGYEYASRIKRFHTSYVTFDFYSPMFTEIYWYSYTPYTWGVSIYDDWDYYGPVVSRYTWRSGFGGSYWWGYDPWWNYNPWMGYGWDSWYSPGVSYSINFHLGRPYYHYPMAWNRWHHFSDWNYSRPVYIINNNYHNYYYGSTVRNSYSSGGKNYNPSNPYENGRRTGYTVTDGRSSTIRNASSAGNTGASQAGNDRRKSNNGLRMGQYRRGTVTPAEPKPNEPDRPNNPNVNDRMNPGREKANATGNATRTRSITQNTVRTTTQKRESVVRQTTPQGKTEPAQSTVRKETRRNSVNSSESKSSQKEEGKKSVRNAASSRNNS
jgi:hypothetical protein